MTKRLHGGNAQAPRCLPHRAIGWVVRSASRRPRLLSSTSRALGSTACCIQTINHSESSGGPSIGAPSWLISMAATASVMFASPAYAAPSDISSMTSAQQSEVCSSAGIEQATGKLNVSQNVFNRAHRLILICEAPGDQLNEYQTFGVAGNEDKAVRGTGNRIWEASLVLTRFMEAGLPDDYWNGKRVVELGGGQGLVSITAAALGADEVYLTDGDESALNLAEANAALNEKLWAASETNSGRRQDLSYVDVGHRLHTSVLRWGEPLPAAASDLQPDVILASDTLYNIRSLGAFITTLNDLSTPDTRIFVANRHRIPAEKDLQLQLLSNAFEMEELPLQPELMDGLDPGTVSVYSLRKPTGSGSSSHKDPAAVVSDLMAVDEVCWDPQECIYKMLELQRIYSTPERVAA